MTKHEKYNRSEKGRARSERYRATPKGRANERSSAVRQRVREREEQIRRIEEELA